MTQTAEQVSADYKEVCVARLEAKIAELEREAFDHVRKIKTLTISNTLIDELWKAKDRRIAELERENDKANAALTYVMETLGFLNESKPVEALARSAAKRIAELERENAELRPLLNDALGAVQDKHDMRASVEPLSLRRAAQAVVDRWDTPLWKDAPATAIYINDLRAALTETQPAEPKERCEWGFDHGDGVWQTGCGHLHLFLDDGPKENDYKFCPYCGNTLDDLGRPPNETKNHHE